MQSQHIWKFIWAGIVLLGLIAAASTFVFAQSGGETATPEATEESSGDGTTADEERIDFVARLAERLGISEEELRQAVMDTETAIVDEWLAEGRIDEEKAARLKERIEEKNGDLHALGPRFGHHHFGFGPMWGDELAEFLGVTVDQVGDALRDGQSLAEIAEANGKSRQELIDFLVGQVEEKLNEKVADNEINQERADEILQRFRDKVDKLVDAEFGSPFHRHRFGPGPFFGPDDDAEDTDESSDSAAISPLVY